MDRRQFILTAGATAVTGTLVSATALLQGASVAAQNRQGDKERQAVGDACNRCMKTGKACLAMCNEMLRHGMTALADCQARVVDMLTMCDAMGTMIATNTAPPAPAGVGAEVC